MPLLDFFKKKGLKKEKKEQEPKIKKEKPEVKEKRPKKEKSKKKRVKREISPTAYRVLIKPHITEKATDLSTKNQYVFKVFAGANKTEIRNAVKQIYGVDVLKVRIINVPQKPKRWGQTQGFKKGYKKAVVKIKQGQKIEIIPR